MDRRLLSLAAILSLGACATKPDAAPQSPPSSSAGAAPQDTSIVRADKARIQGSESAKVWLVIASDFQCPFCREFHDDIYKKILKDYVAPGKIRVAFLNHPMAFHAMAIPAAEAAMCAGKQDRFWEMHDGLFMTQEKWTKRTDPQPVFDSLATSLKLRVDDWRACFTSHATRAMIDADLFRSKGGGVTGTPSFFVDNRLALIGIEPYENFRRELDAAIARAGGK